MFLVEQVCEKARYFSTSSRWGEVGRRPVEGAFAADRALSHHTHDPSPSSHAAGSASDGIRQSPRGDRLTVPTFGPSGMHERLYC